MTRAVPWMVRRADYRFLEEVGSTADATKRVKPSDKRGSEASARTDLELLRREAHARGVELLFQPQGMERRRMNTSWYCKRCVRACHPSTSSGLSCCSLLAAAHVRASTSSASAELTVYCARPSTQLHMHTSDTRGGAKP